ncbi:MAG: hypothetical protein ACP5G7_08120 [Anaerolineae bacterium]
MSWGRRSGRIQLGALVVIAGALCTCSAMGARPTPTPIVVSPTALPTATATLVPTKTPRPMPTPTTTPTVTPTMALISEDAWYWLRWAYYTPAPSPTYVRTTPRSGSPVGTIPAEGTTLEAAPTVTVVTPEPQGTAWSTPAPATPTATLTPAADGSPTADGSSTPAATVTSTP